MVASEESLSLEAQIDAAVVVGCPEPVAAESVEGVYSRFLIPKGRFADI